MGWGFSSLASPDIEFYLVTHASLAGKSYGEFLISNVVQIGSVGLSTQPRQWNDEIRAAHEKDKLKDVPPTQLPTGYVAIEADAPLAPGMPIQVGHYGDWVDAEYLGEAGDGRVTMRFAGRDQATTMKRAEWTAAMPDVLARAASNPSSFSPSMRVLPSGGSALPSNLVAIPKGLNLPKGAPLMAYWGHGWELRYVVADLGSKIKVLRPSSRDFFGKHSGNRNAAIELASAVKRSTLAIDKETLLALDDPQQVATFAENLVYKGDGFNDGEGGGDADGFGADDDFHVIDRSYPIKISIPKRAVKLPDNIELPKGTLVAYNWARRWEAANVVRDDGDNVLVKEKDSITSFVYRLDRDQLIIQTKTLATIKRKARKSADDLKQTLRTWTDATGKFKIEARLVKKEGGKVTIKTDAGREITLPIAKLSDDDQELLKNMVDEADNPFAG